MWDFKWFLFQRLKYPTQENWQVAMLIATLWRSVCKALQASQLLCLALPVLAPQLGSYSHHKEVISLTPGCFGFEICSRAGLGGVVGLKSSDKVKALNHWLCGRVWGGSPQGCCLGRRPFPPASNTFVLRQFLCLLIPEPPWNWGGDFGFHWLQSKKPKISALSGVSRKECSWPSP